LEERQRIAKDIHDTAGHSLTTVIMQTEAAKRIVEEDPKEAKNKIVAANLQAKHALDELRNSVHLLSGGNEQQTLKGDLEGILHETMDGTEIIIRSEIEDLTLSPTKHRFLCNSLKEGISNGLRHGGATAFWFELKQDGDKVEFLLSDNGKGLGKDFIMGFGLTSMRDRARTLGGEVYLESEEGEGVELRIQL
jgi:signal transduction histidine kinase